MIIELQQKRRHPRMECSGNASLHLLGEGIDFRGKIIDLSLEGCLIALEESAGLKVDAVVELSFSVRQLPFRVRAQVKVMRSPLLIGFHFLMISGRASGQMGELIEELSDERLQQMPGSRHQSGGSGIEVRPLRASWPASS